MTGNEPVSAEEQRRQAIERAARALTSAIVDLIEAAAMPLSEETVPIEQTAPRNPDDALKLPEIAQITGLAEQTLRNLRYKGGGPPIWVLRGRLRCYRADLEAWMTETREDR